MSPIVWNLIFLFLGLVLAVPLNILANRPNPISRWLDQRATTTGKKKLAEIVNEYNLIVLMRQSHATALLLVLRPLTLGLAIFITLGMEIVIVTIMVAIKDVSEIWVAVNLFAGGIFWFLGLKLFWAAFSDLGKVILFPSYQAETKKRIREFDGKPNQLPAYAKKILKERDFLAKKIK